ncbi:MAG: helix-turn-helix domain-containing protein [Bacteroidota bacterium]
MSNPAEFTERFINQTNHPIFLTGKAGTGKTTLLKRIIDATHKNAVIVAPTGIAAINAGGVTIHSFFQLPFAGFIPDFNVQASFSENAKLESKSSLLRHFKMNKFRQDVLRKLELLIIDEVSMLRADLLDAIDWTLRNVRRDNAPFGGVQVLYIGDLMQLPPVIKNEEWHTLRNYYSGAFFFNAKVIQEQPPLYIELTKIYRQQQSNFIEILNNLRNNAITQSNIETLNQLVDPNFDATRTKGYITITTHNHKADTINQSALKALDEKSKKYTAEVTGEFPPHLFPIELEMDLKIGAQVMFIKNDLSFEKNFFNGKMGEIEVLDEDEITVYFPEEKKKIKVDKYEWSNIRYEVDANTGEIKEKTLGTFVHYPLKLAWAITVHKSQGLTFEKAVIDVSEVFAPGQAYVALSRLTSLDGLVLLKPIKINGISSDSQVINYAENRTNEEQFSQLLSEGTKSYLLHALKKYFDWNDLVLAWAAHEKTYLEAGSKTEKGKNKTWVITQGQTIEQSADAMRKFTSQLNTIILQKEVDLAHLNQRVQAAYDYFFKLFDGVLISNLKQIFSLSKVRKTKNYVEELQDLDELLTNVVINLKRARILAEAVFLEKELTKDLFSVSEIQNYKLAKKALLQQEMRSNPRDVFDLLSSEHDEDEDLVLTILKAKPSKKEKLEKISTYEQTLQMLSDGKSASEIARERQLSENTIVSHFAKLILQEKIELSDVLSQQRISELEDLLQEYEGLSLTAMKEELGDKVSYNELKLIQASKII